MLSGRRLSSQPTSRPLRRSGQSLFASATNTRVINSGLSTTQGPRTNLTINVTNGEIERPSIDRAHQTADQSFRIDSPQASQGNTASLGNSAWSPPVVQNESSAEIYARQMTSRARGFPLWNSGPNNNLPVEYRRTGVRLGDVGIITSWGSFSFLFNIFVPADDPVNAGRVPEGFIPLPFSIHAIDVDKRSEFGPKSYIASGTSSVNMSESDSASVLTFKMSTPEGAVLAMPEGAISETIESVDSIRKYVEANILNWYQYANGVRGRGARNGDIRVVLGHDKSNSCGMAITTNATPEVDCSLKFSDLHERRSIPTYTWEHSGLTDVRTGLTQREVEEIRNGDASPPENGKYVNQCLFIRALNPTLANNVWAQLYGRQPQIFFDWWVITRRHKCEFSARQIAMWWTKDSKYYRGNIYGLSPIYRYQQYVVREGPTSSSCDTRETLRLALYKFPDAKMAITEDSNWMAILKIGEVIQWNEAFCRQVLEAHQVDEDNGVLFLRKTDLITSTNDELSRLQNDGCVEQSSQEYDLNSVLGGMMALAQQSEAQQSQLNMPLCKPALSEASAPVAQHKGIRRALLISIENVCNSDSLHLRGSHEDAKRLGALLQEKYQYSPRDITYLLDSPGYEHPTRGNIIKHAALLVADAKAHDQFFFHCSGLSDQSYREDSTPPCEEIDGGDECTLASGSDVTQELQELLVNSLPPGASLMAVFDSCHSGTLLDLPHYRCNRVYLPFVNQGVHKTRSRWARQMPSPKADSDRVAYPNNGIMASTYMPHLHSAAWKWFSSFSNARVNLPTHQQPLSEARDKNPTAATVESTQELSVDTQGAQWCDSAPMYNSPDPNFQCNGFDCRSRTYPHTANVISISSSVDDQPTWEEKDGSSMTMALIEFLSTENPHPKLTDLLSNLSFTLHAHAMKLRDQAAVNFRSKMKKLNGRRFKKDKEPLNAQSNFSLERINFQIPELSSLQPLAQTRSEDALTTPQKQQQKAHQALRELAQNQSPCRRHLPAARPETPTPPAAARVQRTATRLSSWTAWESELLASPRRRRVQNNGDENRAPHASSSTSVTSNRRTMMCPRLAPLTPLLTPQPPTAQPNA
ncbi:unnamed protein product [Cyclocybe aegerita]|uniref:Peptidase C14 caspase domain-containing protein n=1 Tax=Cyclocybe aegerita TaxID=1973307 RepID=A0A8S0X8J0_CYCAE|nr:unnamed protein product [Cyclocybe aegerita]